MDKRKKPKIISYTIRVPAYIQSRFDEVCQHEDKSRNQAIIESMWEFVEVQGNFIESRKHFKMSMEDKLDENAGRIERLHRQYFALIINLLVVLIKHFIGDKGVHEAFGLIDKVDREIHLTLKKKADVLAPPKPQDWAPKKTKLPKE